MRVTSRVIATIGAAALAFSLAPSASALAAEVPEPQAS